jgi:hypothetical protein
LCEPVRDSTAEAGAGSDDQQVAWIDGGAAGRAEFVIVVLLLNAR